MATSASPFAAFANTLAEFDVHNGLDTPSLLEVSPGGTGSPTPPTGTNSTPSIGGTVGSMMGSVVSSAAGSVLSGLFSTRVIAIISGLLVIGGALFLFGADEIFGGISSAAKTAAKVVA